jgi:exodeoxyribonuclease VII large subunit
MNTQEILTVQELTLEIKRYIEQNEAWRDIWVRGEISNFTQHSRGHMYFTLKDEVAKIRCVMFQRYNRWLKFEPDNGLKVLVRGEVNLYERDGQYQLYVKEMQPDGIGALFQAYEELKEKLRLKGWFDPERKKPIPFFPKKIGVITSPTGAAVRDIITTIKRRFPIVEIVVIPVLVQGREAADSVAKAIRLAHNYPFDVLIVGRGGGSVEELWAFNEEVVAEAIYHSDIPIISAVGHETDFTIADFVADLRAPTPTAAAELAVPVLADLEKQVEFYKRRLSEQIIRLIIQKRERISQLRNRYAFKYPQTLVRQKEQELDQALDRLFRGTDRYLSTRRQDLTLLAHRLSRVHPKQMINRTMDENKRLRRNLLKAISHYLKQREDQLQLLLTKMDGLSPLKIMSKGYALVYDKGRKRMYHSVREVQPGQAIEVMMHDGLLDCQVWGIKEEGNDEPGQ